VQTDLGAVWKPKVAEGWAPFQNGRWRWYEALGYTWISDESWGWVPYHHGRWTRKGDLGWVWVPAVSNLFKPGDVYWLYNAKLAGWGPLAPSENWQPSAAPEQFLNVNTTYANFQQDARTIDPAGFKDRPKEPLGVAVFALALPSPALPASRLEATRPLLRVGATRLNPVVPGTTFPDNRDTNDVPPPAPPTMPPAVVTNPASDAPPNVSAGPPPDPGPPGPPMQVIYPVPVYTGIVVVNPPEHPDYSRRNTNSQRSKQTPAPAASAPVPLSPPSGGTPPSTTSRSTPLPPAGRPGVSSKPGATQPAPTTPTTVPASTPPTVPGPPRINLPAPRPPLDHPSPAPIPVGRDTPRISRPEPKPENKPEAKPAPKTDSSSDDKANPRQDTSRASKK
jgi:hypothetical protein